MVLRVSFQGKYLDLSDEVSAGVHGVHHRAPLTISILFYFQTTSSLYSLHISSLQLSDSSFLNILSSPPLCYSIFIALHYFPVALLSFSISEGNQQL